MRILKTPIIWLVCLALTAMLTACGSGAGGGDELDPAAAAPNTPNTPTAPNTPTVQGSAADGEVLYDNFCSRCHSLQPHDVVGSPDLAGKGDVIATKLQTSHMGNTLTSVELADLIAFANQGQVEAPAPGTGAGTDTGAGPGTDTGTGTGTVTDGATLFNNFCGGCHNFSSSDFFNLTGDGAKVGTKFTAGVVGHQQMTFSAAQIEAIATFVDAQQAPDTGTGAGTGSGTGTTPPAQCGSCHGLPPANGAHAVHMALPGVSGNCAVCHTSASAPTHMNGWVDLAIASTYNARSGAAGENPDGTPSCVAVSCHGGQTTPDWGSGTINVNTQCVSCHARGTSQYNSYNSGEHGRSAHTRQACTACHNTTTLAANHFSRLDSPTMEGPAAATVGGGSTRVNSYNASTQTCTTSCHGSERW